MYKIVVVTDPDTGDGFRLAGASVIEVRSAEDAAKVIPPVLNDEEVGIVAVREDFMACLDKGLLGRIEQCYHPIIIPIPAPRIGGTMGSYIEFLLKKAIGYNIVMRS